MAGFPNLFAALDDWINAIHIEDEEQKQRAVNVQWISIVGAALYAVAGLVFGFVLGEVAIAAALWAIVLIAAVGIWIIRRTYITLVSLLALVLVSSLLTYAIAQGGGMNSYGFALYPVLVVYGSLLVSRRLQVVYVVIVIASIGFVIYADASGMIKSNHTSRSPLVLIQSYAAIVFTAALISGLTGYSLERARTRIRVSQAELLAQKNMLDVANRELSAANTALMQTNRLKDEFLANMGHELRTPLNAILNLSGALSEGAYGPLNEKQLKSLRTVEDSGRSLTTLLNDILDLSKIMAGQLALQIETVPLEMICASSVRRIGPTAQMKGVAVSLSADKAVQTVQADARRLVQILVNLLQNAVKFTPEGGSVGLEAGADPERSVVRFVVWDTGIGIAPEDLGRLFQPFVQLDAKLAQQHGGTGLGLALVKQLVELHGGSVSVESEQGHGSRFTVTLPLILRTV